MLLFGGWICLIDNFIFDLLCSCQESIVLLYNFLPTFGINNYVVLVIIFVPIGSLLYTISLESWIWFWMRHDLLMIHQFWCVLRSDHFWVDFRLTSQLCKNFLRVILSWGQVRYNWHARLLIWNHMLAFKDWLLLWAINLGVKVVIFGLMILNGWCFFLRQLLLVYFLSSFNPFLIL